jgi:hypothetical protein
MDIHNLLGSESFLAYGALVFNIEPVPQTLLMEEMLASEDHAVIVMGFLKADAARVVLSFNF